MYLVIAMRCLVRTRLGQYWQSLFGSNTAACGRRISSIEAKVGVLVDTIHGDLPVLVYRNRSERHLHFSH